MPFRFIAMTLQQIFISNLKKARKEQGISQMVLSKMCDTSANYIGQIEMGRRIPSFEKIEQIATALEIPPHMLFRYEVEEEKVEKKLNAKEYLRKKPVKVKKEIVSHLLDAIKNDLNSFLDSQNY